MRSLAGGSGDSDETSQMHLRASRVVAGLYMVLQHISASRSCAHLEAPMRQHNKLLSAGAGTLLMADTLYWLWDLVWRHVLR